MQREGEASAMVALRDALEAGDVRQVDDCLSVGLSGARFSDGTTPLMLAVTHADARVAAELLDVVLQHGAKLHARDEFKRDALMHACCHGAHASVIERLMHHGEKLGGWQLKWGNRDRDGLDAVALASKGGHGKLAAHLLDHVLDLDTLMLENYPLKVLQVALVAGDEASALDVLKSARIQRAVRLTRDDMVMARNPWQDNCTVYSCVEAAVQHNLVAALDAMLALNRGEVARATWYSLGMLDTSMLKNQRRSDELVPADSAEPPQPRWPLVSCLLAPWTLLRDALDGSAGDASGLLLASRLATLPDPLFRLVMRCLVPVAAEELDQIRFWLDARRCRRCKGLCIPGECRGGESLR